MLNLIIFGPPGAGKGTQAGLIAEKYKLTHLSSGDLLRRELKNGKLGAQIKKYQDAGKLVPDKITIKLIETAIIKNISCPGFIFDGYPRNPEQAAHLDGFLKKKKMEISSVLNLRLGEDEAVKRALSRGKTSGRSDDNLKTIKNRFKTYRAQTAPLLSYYRQQRKLITIDGRPSIKEVFKAIAAAIKTL